MGKRYLILLSILSFLFLLLYAILSYYSRLATDDYYFIGDIKNHGTFEQVYFQYMNWSGRYTATLAMNCIYNFLEIKQTYYNLLPPLSLLLLVTGVYYLFQNICKYYSLTTNYSILTLYSLSASAFFFFLSYDIAESWFWYCGYSSYLWSITALIWGVALLINNKTKWYTTLFASLCFAYVGGASELYNSIIGLYFTLYLISIYRKSKQIKKIWQNLQTRKILIAYIAFSFSFIILIAAPGNYLRDGLFPEHSFVKAIFLTLKSIVKFLIIYFPSKSIYIFCFAPLFILLGISLKSKFQAPLNSFKEVLKKATAVFISTLLLFFYTTAFVMMESGPARVLLFVSFLFTCYIIFISIYAGLTLSFISEKKLKIIPLALGIAMLFFHIINQSIVASKYSKANDDRIIYLTQLKQQIKKDTLIILSPLPPSGMLYSSEITTDTTHFTNREVKMGYDLPFHVAKREK